MPGPRINTAAAQVEAAHLAATDDDGQTPALTRLAAGQASDADVEAALVEAVTVDEHPRGRR